ncbi:acetyl-CoA synthetase-like protein [Ramicandelaber brevisporus]|nr:acetyl-CoA synthetase-like protein [Ramicandelaber brevisporus]
MYSYEVDESTAALFGAGPFRSGEGRARYHPMHRDHSVPLDVSLPGIANLHDIFLNGLRISNNGPYLGKRDTSLLDGTAGPYRWYSYGEIGAMASDFGSGLTKLGVNIGDKIAYYVKNSVEAYTARLSGYEYGHVMTPIYDSLGPNAIAEVLEECQIETIITQVFAAERVLKAAETVKCVKLVVLLDCETDTRPDLRLMASKLGIQLYGTKAVQTLGNSPASPRAPPQRTPGKDDLALILPTSGTSGKSKLVVLSNQCFIIMIGAADWQLKHSGGAMFSYEGPNVMLSFLPMAHIYDQGASLMCTLVGGQIGMWSGDPLLLLEDMQALRPTLFAGVPRLFNRIHDKVWSTVRAKGGLAQKLFERAYATKSEALLNHGETKHWLWDRLVFSKIGNMLGGRVNTVFSGSAPISAEVKTFMRVVFSAQFVEAYGQSENTALSTATDPNDPDTGHVGGPQPGVLVKLIDVPEMNYTSADKPFPRGEICTKGLSNFVEYLGEPQKTAETIDEDGYVHSGDIGLWDDKGRLVIIDRKSSIIKIAQGVFVAPEKIAQILQDHPLIAQAYVHGDPLKPFLVAVIVLDEESLPQYLDENPQLGLSASDGTFADACASDALKQNVLKVIDEWCRKRGCVGYEIVKNIYLEPVPFSVENGLLSQTMKMKRNIAREYYREKLVELFDTAIDNSHSKL